MGAKEAKSDEFEHVREYLPCLSVSEPSTDVVVDTMAAALARAAELMHAEAGAPKAVDVITTDDRKKLLFDRKEQERLAKEKAEREAAEAELKKVRPVVAPCISPISPPYLPYTSPVSPYISPASPQAVEEAREKTKPDLLAAPLRL